MSSTETDWGTTGFQTRAIHAGQQADLATGATIVPIYQTHAGSTHLYRHTRLSPTLDIWNLALR